MKIKDGFMMRKVGEEYYVVAFGEAAENFQGMIRLNGTGAFIWKLLEDGTAEDEIVTAILDTYDGVDAQGAKESLNRFTESIQFALA